jgi:hypothetical protein
VRVTAAYSRRPLTETADAFLESLRQSFGNSKQGAGEEPAEVAESLSKRRVYAQQFVKLLRPWNVLCANVSGVAQGVSSIVHGSSLPDAVSRALGSLALVGPAFVVVEVLAFVNHIKVPRWVKIPCTPILARKWAHFEIPTNKLSFLLKFHFGL